MKILVAGASGLIGTALVSRLNQQHHEVSRLVRRSPVSSDEIQWDPDSGAIDEARMAGTEAVIHLGGASIAGRRWNDAYKQEIRDSRVNSTRLLSEASPACRKGLKYSCAPPPSDTTAKEPTRC